jgi:prepilin-type N-terminal cleavage/methylation domain-containing protein
MKRKKKKSIPKGFTLVELTVVVALMSLIMLILMSLYVTGQQFLMTESARNDVIRDNRYVFDWISRDIKGAVQVVSSWDAYTTSSNCLILRIPSVDSSGLIVDIENELDHIIYRLNSEHPNKLERVVDAKDGVSSRVDSTRVLATRVNSFLLSSDGVELSSVADLTQVASIDIVVTTKQNRLGRDFQQTLDSTVKLRNK